MPPVIIDQLWQGVSGQAPWQRKRGTVKRGKNVRFDIRIGGAVKRNPLELVTQLLPHSTVTMDPSEHYYWDEIRGAKIAIAGGASAGSPVLAWDQFGVPLHVIDTTAGGFAAYMDSAVDPLHDIEVASKRDTLIVTNRRSIMTNALEEAWTYTASLRYLRDGDPNSSSLPESNGVEDHTVTFFSELEELDPEPIQGDVWKVVADENLDPAGLYMYFPGTPHANYEAGYFPQHDNWYRVPKANSPKAAYNEELMPHKLVYNEAAGTITISRVRWRQRISGNQHTVPPMAWALSPGFHVRDVVFFDGRLFLLSEEHITASRHDDFFNLWVENVSAIADNDRLSRNVTESHLGELLRATQVGESLLILFEQAQCEFSANGEPLTNRNGHLAVLTDFPSYDVSPGYGPGVGTFMDRYGDVHQYTWVAVDLGRLSYTGLLTAHTPRLFHGEEPLRIFMFGTTVFVVMASGRTFVHDSFSLKSGLAQSAWSEFETTEDVMYVQPWAGQIYIVTHLETTEGDYTLTSYLHRTAPPPPGLHYMPRLDRLELVSASLISYDPAADETTIPHTARDGDLAKSFCVTRKQEFVVAKRIDDAGNPVFAGNIAVGTSGAIVAQYLGFNWDSELELSELYIDKTALATNMTNLAVFHHETTDYLIEWQPYPGANFRSVSFQAKRTAVTVIDEPEFETKFKGMTVVGDPRTMLIRIRSATPGQFAIMALEYLLNVAGRTDG